MYNYTYSYGNVTLMIEKRLSKPTYILSLLNNVKKGGVSHNCRKVHNFVEQ